ncbi:MAG: nucleotidyl transferase AbiEii/AbiGii toxin family protein [Planctomycetes bacterium]|nr:nucleotidyl transferase AbiEii/AbiGii toxin family protein [Planctomycetota bacterium]
MIAKQDILDRVAEWRLRADVVEKDYVLGWLLAAIARHPATQGLWVFKGGTCLKKCLFETHRFSEDLDFSLLPEAEYTEETLREALQELARSATDMSGITFPPDAVAIRQRRDKLGRDTYEGKVGYHGPLYESARTTPRVVFDLTRHEPVLDGEHRRGIHHPFPDALPEVSVRAYSLAELLAEKTRALFERTRPRDLYDVVFMVENAAEAVDLELVRNLFGQKCRAKGLMAPSAAGLAARVAESQEMRSEWANMLEHQLPQLPPVEALLDRLAPVLAWIDAPRPVLRPRLGSAPLAAGAELVAPSGAHYWGMSVPLELIRFAGANRLLIAFPYHGRQRVVEPYSLRRSSQGNLLLYAWEGASATIKAFKVTEIADLKVTSQSFVPRYRVEFTATGSLTDPPAASRPPSARTGSPAYHGQVYVFACPFCRKQFRHHKNDPALRAHKSDAGGNCIGRRGDLLRIE